MSVSPLEERYKTEMNAIFEEENKLRKWLLVESALAKANAKAGNIPKKAAEEIEAKSANVKLERVKQIEEEIHHDLMAMVKALTEQCTEESGKYIHLGATSYDIEDTAQALIFKEAFTIIKSNVKKTIELLKKLAQEKKDLVCVARTHGQHAVPTTYGMKFALYLQEFQRHLERIEEAEKRIYVGKMTGAAGTMASFGEKAFEIQEEVMRILGLAPAKVTNQVIQRDRYAEAVFLLALIACSIEKVAKEMRNLQRNEIMELAEPFKKKSQVGSSTMPQKRNPHKSERLCSLARIIRSNLHVAMENIALEHERDLTNSANERYIFPEAFITVNFMLEELNKILGGLDFFPENIRRNLYMSEILAERAMIELVKKGEGRQEAHEIVRKKTIEALEKGKRLKELMGEYFSKKELDEIFTPENYIGKAKEIVDKAMKE